ncbi:phosphodiesterase [Tepiditoga spiralis]|uniref:Phosphodiesterase n=1 Tax=Tepiditoga spiralis TaxID=2108365 RepID=A0A7G1GA24_9BACT|nr:HDIG domain-containing metalloprotein [Tepiditoga spiralis]BBE31887.1 phosphodiesterase [Tepiditoga spiralis]
MIKLIKFLKLSEIKIPNYREQIFRGLLFIFLSIIAEFFLWKQITFSFQIIFNTVFLSLWIFVIELIMSYKRLFKLHRKNYWGAFLTPLIINILINLFIFKYVNIFAVSGILSTLMITMLIDFESGIISAITFSIFFGGIFGFDIKYMILLFIPSAIVAYFSKGINRRVEIIFPFFISSIIQILLTYIFKYKHTTEDIFLLIGSNFINTLITMGILPFIEYITRVYSNIGLLELGNLNNPLLKKLTLRAPGTYYHSMIISNIAESAAEAIGGNSTLARVGSYFHDIGKIWKPIYFTENQKSENPHNNISPKLSSLILNNHIVYGIELAKKNRLPILIEDMIAQHQGTRIKQYFFKKYYDETGIYDKEMFKYPGPIPQFKESAILMFCDVTEAMSRSLKEITPSILNEKLDKLLESLFAEGQLDDCGLTLREFKKMKGQIIRTMLEMNHKRIKYPKIEVDKLRS